MLCSSYWGEGSCVIIIRIIVVIIRIVIILISVGVELWRDGGLIAPKGRGAYY